jgi:hypothetical protein
VKPAGLNVTAITFSMAFGTNNIISALGSPGIQEAGLHARLAVHESGISPSLKVSKEILPSLRKAFFQCMRPSRSLSVE